MLKSKLVKQKDHIVLPNVLFSLIKTKENYTIVDSFYKLKCLTNCGLIKDYRKKYEFLSIKLGLCESTIRQRISLLKSKGLVRVENNNLCISSKAYLLEYLGYKNSHSKDTKNVRFSGIKFHKDHLYNDNNTIKIIDKNTGLILDSPYEMKNNNKYNVYDIHNIKNFENNYKIWYNKNDIEYKERKKDFKYILYAYKIDSNLSQQKEAYTNKLIKTVSKEYSTETNKGKRSSYEKKIQKLVKKDIEKDFNKLRTTDHYSVELTFSNTIDIFNSELKNNSEATRLKEFINSNRNCNFTLSRKGIAKQSGFRSKATGNKIINKLKTLNLIEVDKRNEYYFNDNGNMFDTLIENKNLTKYGKVIYSSKHKSSKLILSNSIKIDNYILNYGFNNKVVVNP